MGTYYIVRNGMGGDHIAHYGVIGMKWGNRRYQNEDGSLTPEGRKHYQYTSFGSKHNDRKALKTQKKIDKLKASGKEDDFTKEKLKRLETKKANYERRAERSRELDAREQEYASKVSTGGNIAARVLTGGVVGGKAYQQWLSMMNGQGRESNLKKGAAIAATILGGGRVGSTLAKAIYIRRTDEGGIGEGVRKVQSAASTAKSVATTAKKGISVGYGKVSSSINNAYDKQKQKKSKG